MLTIILAGLALVFALLALFEVPSRVSWAALGVLCLAVLVLFGRFGVG